MPEVNAGEKEKEKGEKEKENEKENIPGPGQAKSISELTLAKLPTLEGELTLTLLTSHRHQIMCFRCQDPFQQHSMGCAVCQGDKKETA